MQWTSYVDPGVCATVAHWQAQEREEKMKDAEIWHVTDVVDS